MATAYPEALLTAKWRLLEAVRAYATFAAEFQVSAENVDRPIADTPWLEKHRFGPNRYDARWYSVMGARDHFSEGIAGAVEDEIAALFAIAYMEGLKAAEGSL